jgi:polyferredoxin
MLNFLNKFKSRVASQIAGLVVLNGYFLRLHSICVPAFNCHSCPVAVFACPIGILVNFSSLRIFPFITVGILGLVGIIGGRWVCGWICPFGLLQDGLYKIPTKKITISSKLVYIKYIVLIGLVLAVPFFFIDSRLVFCRLCPAGTLESAIPWKIMGRSSGDNFGFFLRMSVLIGVLVLMITVNRGFCRILCPLGAIFAIFNRISLFRIRLIKQDLNNDELSSKDCPVDIDPVKQINSPECILCLECTSKKHLKLGIK